MRFLLTLMAYLSLIGKYTALYFGCELPEGCRITYVHSSYQEILNENPRMKQKGIECKIKEGFAFRFHSSHLNEPYPSHPDFVCRFETDKKDLEMGLIQQSTIELIWPSDCFKSVPLDSKINFTALIRYLGYFNDQINVNILNLGPIQVEIFDPAVSIYDPDDLLRYNLFVTCINCKLVFYNGDRAIRTCRDLEDVTRITSLFQMSQIFPEMTFRFAYSLFQTPMCPLLFNNSNIWSLSFIGLVNTFYKKRLFEFTTDTHEFENNSSLSIQVKSLSLFKVENIRIDSTILNPIVFSKINSLFCYGVLDSISGHDLDKFAYLYSIQMESLHFRNLIHKIGIDWIIALNSKINFNLSDPKTTTNKNGLDDLFKIIYLSYENSISYKKSEDTFPDSDFCAYTSFPFSQLVAIIRKGDAHLEHVSSYSCTYVWLIQYYEVYVKIYKKFWNLDFAVRKFYNYSAIIPSVFLSSKAKCDFQTRLFRCKKSNYKIKDIWSTEDFYLLNKKLETAIKIFKYLICFFGIVTNSIIMAVILNKKNKELFKDFRQYSYLCLNSLFNLLILLIELLSWTTECFYPQQVFCPGIRQFVAMQYLRIIFHECLVTAFKFMCNFTYIAFALNRISLIGREHVKLVKFMSKVGIKKYIGVTLVISIGLSVIKGFKYQINHDLSEFSFPMPIEFDLISTNFFVRSNSKAYYFFLSVISDLLNYLVLWILCLATDAWMLIKLRRVLNEKLNKSSASMNQIQQAAQKKECEDSINKAIRMVVLNTLFGAAFKLPACFISFIYLLAHYFYKNPQIFYDWFSGSKGMKINLKFSFFFTTLHSTGFFTVISNLSDLSYAISISFVFFIYVKYDKKFNTGFDTLRKKENKEKKSVFNILPRNVIQ